MHNRAPDYAQIIQNLIDNASESDDVDEAVLPDEIVEGLAEYFPEPFTEQVQESGADNEADVTLSLPTEEPRSDRLVREINQMRTDLDTAKGSLARVMAAKRETRKNRKDTEEVGLAKMTRKEQSTAEEKSLKAQIKAAEKAVAELEYSLASLTIRGQLRVLLSDETALEELKEKWVARELDSTTGTSKAARGRGESQHHKSSRCRGRSQSVRQNTSRSILIAFWEKANG